MQKNTTFIAILRTTKMEKTDPILNDIQFDDVVDIPGTEENLIKTAKMEEFLNITISETSEWPVPSVFHITHSSEHPDRPIHTESFRTQLPEKLYFKLPSGRFKKSQKQSLGYILKSKRDDHGWDEWDVKTSFTVDLKNPIEAPPLEMATKEFDLAYLDSHDGLGFKAPTFTTTRVGDRCIVNINGPENISVTLETPARENEDPITGKIPKDTFFIAGKPIYGKYTVMYTALSRAGNDSSNTEAVTVTFSAS